ncbi:hypothetical protein AJ80_09999 [Polytolypa hystricis UAMH7299]|uniref:C2H2-type domain-containing protein n=1 Tax=Polytolypa hystricis (strain UAMH7299) TaxID=1447883 RepID=A0A2B7WF77_POLH7|nr:hypothetical protein AJ80_09999 [Polytolypa hystricis UAMH7299]
MTGDAPTISSPPWTQLSPINSTNDSASIRTRTDCLTCVESRNPAEAAKSEDKLTYGCTFPTCTKRFQCIDKWERHENNKHFQLEAWRCSVWNADNHECARLFYHRSKYTEHLRDEHKFKKSETENPLKENRIGRNGQYQYWCGHCRKLVRLHNQGSDAWAERFEHIAQHEQDISDWLLPEGHRTKGEVAAGVCVGEGDGECIESLDLNLYIRE